jgi:hypothetical protein
MGEYEKNYRQNHKKEILEYKKEYYEKNRQILKDKRNEKFLCECGYNISRCNLVKHKVSKRHNDIMRALNNPLSFQQISKN